MLDKEVIRTIKKLLAVSDPAGGATSGEIDNALAMIDKLLRKNNLSMSEVQSLKDEEIGISQNESEFISKNHKWIKFVASAIGKLCECAPTVKTQKNRVGMWICFIGTAYDIKIAGEMFAEFTDKIAKSARYLYQRAAQQRSYCNGFACVLLSRVEALKNQPETTAMIYVGKKAQAIQKFKDNKKIKQAPTQTISAELGDQAFAKGILDGSQISLALKEKEKKGLLS